MFLCTFSLFQAGPPGIQCQLCYMMFSDQSAISTHYDTVHSQTRRAKRSEGRHECDVCGKKLSDKRWLRHHMATVHGVGDVEKLQCDVCSRVFNHKANLSTHMKKKHGM